MTEWVRKGASMSANQIRVAVDGQRLDEEFHRDVPSACANLAERSAVS
jgi:hypothetical protein